MDAVSLRVEPGQKRVRGVGLSVNSQRNFSNSYLVDGLSANAGEPPQNGALIAVLLGLLALLLCLGFGATLVAALLLACAIGLMAWLCVAQIGGQTGDMLGAVEQVSEIVILLVAAAWF